MPKGLNPLYQVYKVFLIGALVLCCVYSRAYAVETGDFSYKGICLGDDASVLEEKLGAPLFERELSVFGERVVYYTYREDVIVGVSGRAHNVVDIRAKGEKIALRDGVRYGATRYKIEKTYGKVKRELLEGETSYVYREAFKGYALVLGISNTEGTLQSVRITSLPLTEEEARLRGESEDDDGEYTELDDVLTGEKEIDMSAVPKTADATLRRGGNG